MEGYKNKSLDKGEREFMEQNRLFLIKKFKSGNKNLRKYKKNICLMAKNSGIRAASLYFNVEKECIIKYLEEEK